MAEGVAADGLKSTEFSNPEYGHSNWFMPLTYHGDAEVYQEEYVNTICLNMTMVLCFVGGTAWPANDEGTISIAYHTILFLV